MAGWKLHVLFGFLFVTITYFFVTYWKVLSITDLQLFLYLPIVFVYSQLPDIDSNSSIIRRLFYLVCFLSVIVLFLLWYLYRENMYLWVVIIISFVMFSSFFLVHRGWLHTLLGGLLLCLPLLYFSSTIFVLSLAAYSSHLVLDGKFRVTK
jgi:RsiW-degrading membrane proteinase PrsW (M82 family)